MNSEESQFIRRTVEEVANSRSAAQIDRQELATKMATVRDRLYDAAEGRVSAADGTALRAAFVAGQPVQALRALAERRRSNAFRLEDRQSAVALIYKNLLGAFVNGTCEEGSVAVREHWLSARGTDVALLELASEEFEQHRHDRKEDSQTATAAGCYFTIIFNVAVKGGSLEEQEGSQLRSGDFVRIFTMFVQSRSLSFCSFFLRFLVC